MGSKTVPDETKGISDSTDNTLDASSRGLDDKTALDRGNDGFVSPFDRGTHKSSPIRPQVGYGQSKMQEPDPNLNRCVKTVDYVIEPEDHLITIDQVLPDESLDTSLRKDVKNVHQKNWEWNKKMNLDKFNAFSPFNLKDHPNAYANRARLTQEFFNDSKLSEKIIGRRILKDGIWGWECNVILYNWWSKNNKDKSFDRLYLKKYEQRYKIYSTYINYEENILIAIKEDELTDKQQQQLTDIEAYNRYILAYKSKPEVIADWNFVSNVDDIIAFLLKNHVAAHPGEAYDSVFIKAREAWRNDELSLHTQFESSLGSLCLVIAKSEEEAIYYNERLDFIEKMQLLRLLYQGEKVKAQGRYFEVKRTYFHLEDLNKMDLHKQHKEISFKFLFGNSQLIDEVEPILNWHFPKTNKLLYAREKMGSQYTSEKMVASGTNSLVGLGLFYQFPKVSRTNLKLASDYANEIVISKQAEEQAANEFIAEIKAKAEAAKLKAADITDYETFMDVLKYNIRKPNKDPRQILLLMQKAKEEFFITVKFEDDEIFLLTFRQIQDCHAKAMYNNDHPLRIGVFKPPEDSGRNVDNVDCIIAHKGDVIEAYQSGTWEELHNRVYTMFEPVKVQTGLIDPDASFVTHFYRDVRGIRNWEIKDYWYLSASLPQATKSLRDNVKHVQGMQGLDMVLTALFAATAFAGPLIGSMVNSFVRIGAEVGIRLTMNMMKSLFWFVVTEKIGQMILNFDHNINSDKKNYSDEDRRYWNNFKFGLMIFGATALIRTAWKGLKFGTSTAFRNQFLLLEAEIKASGSAMRAVSPTSTLTERLFKATESVKGWQKYAIDILGLEMLTVKDLNRTAIRLISKLPTWAIKIIQGLDDILARALFGCSSPCNVNFDKLKNGIVKRVMEKINLETIKGIMPAEILILRNIAFESIDNIIRYAITHQKSIASVKGIIAEEIFRHSLIFKKAMKTAQEKAVSLGFKAEDVRFITGIRGIAPTKTGSGTWGELTDGILAVTDGDDLHIFTVFESKSPSNLRELAKRDGEYLGQVSADLERLRENPVKISLEIGNKVFDPDNISVSRSSRGTEWIGIAPPNMSEVTKSNLVAHIRKGFPQFQLVNGDVRNEILQELASRIVQNIDAFVDIPAKTP